MNKKIIRNIILLVILVSILFLGITLDVFISKERKLDKQDNILGAIEIYNNKFLNNKDEPKGRKILLDKIDRIYVSDNSENHELLYDSLESQTYGYLENIINILEKIESEKAGADVEELLIFFNNFDSLLDTITPLKNIYADPSDYYGKEVIIYGSIKNNDIKRKMLEVGTYLGSFSDSYPLEVDYSNNKKDYWIDTEEGFIIAKGTLKKYSDSNGSYLIPTQIEYIDSVNLSNWNVESVGSQTGETIISKEDVLNLASNIMDNVDLMEEFTLEIIKRWSDAISSKKDFNYAIEQLYKEKNAKFTVITLNYTNHIFKFADMENIPTEIGDIFNQLEIIESLYADFYKSKIEDPKGSLITYSNNVITSLDEIRSAYRKLSNLF